ncbi:hypothetical protein [Nitrosovibrio sp. Nv17]|uniref:hypothetical protein n=1 Tax=Nitrosovibrio sp. Nv17 TaxID=1855339 RepID=UPI00090857AE|nr:hypothetical protein [Nitrosovibrio sp. Nv17]SFW21511.1 hypothetical protein SAMN05216414_10668 [Nitrosovibrio sp. Nv17]
MAEKLDLGALRSAVSSLEDGLDVVSDDHWFSQQSAKVQNTRRFFRIGFAVEGGCCRLGGDQRIIPQDH